ncbi:MAG TPA: HigA family addiction module antitoxin [Casimicrobiaceae bacterium]|nr:HigA family addiction module antitoxin [Casimicrobiaceae bacterium]
MLSAVNAANAASTARRARLRADRVDPRSLRPSDLAVSSRTPLHPGRFLQTRFLTPLGITQTELALALGISRRRVNELIRGRRTITPDTALRLGLFFRNDPMFWMTLQSAWDIHAARRALRSLPSR